MRSGFACLGRLLGDHPWAFATVGLLLSLPALGLLRVELKDRIRDGYTPDDAPSRFETAKMRQFWNSTGFLIPFTLLLSESDIFGYSDMIFPDQDSGRQYFPISGDRIFSGIRIWFDSDPATSLLLSESDWIIPDSGILQSFRFACNLIFPGIMNQNFTGLIPIRIYPTSGLVRPGFIRVRHFWLFRFSEFSFIRICDSQKK